MEIPALHYLSRAEMAQELAAPACVPDDPTWAELAARRVTSADEFLQFEMDAVRAGMAAAGALVQRKILEAHMDRALMKAAGREVRERAGAAGETRPIRHMGPRSSWGTPTRCTAC